MAKLAEWIEDGYYSKPCVCSNCGEDGRRSWKFCPNCGAKMELQIQKQDVAPIPTKPYDLLYEEGGANTT